MLINRLSQKLKLTRNIQHMEYLTQMGSELTETKFEFRTFVLIYTMLITTYS